MRVDPPPPELRHATHVVGAVSQYFAGDASAFERLEPEARAAAVWALLDLDPGLGLRREKTVPLITHHRPAIVRWCRDVLAQAREGAALGQALQMLSEMERVGASYADVPTPDLVRVAATSASRIHRRMAERLLSRHPETTDTQLQPLVESMGPRLYLEALVRRPSPDPAAVLAAAQRSGGHELESMLCDLAEAAPGLLRDRTLRAYVVDVVDTNLGDGWSFQLMDIAVALAATATSPEAFAACLQRIPVSAPLHLARAIAQAPAALLTPLQVPLETIRVLFQSDDVEVRRMAVRPLAVLAPSLPAALIRPLTLDPDGEVRLQAIRALRLARRDDGRSGGGVRRI